MSTAIHRGRQCVVPSLDGIQEWMGDQEWNRTYDRRARIVVDERSAGGTGKNVGGPSQEAFDIQGAARGQRDRGKLLANQERRPVHRVDQPARAEKAQR